MILKAFPNLDDSMIYVEDFSNFWEGSAKRGEVLFQALLDVEE